jgi:hypothetical protein
VPVSVAPTALVAPRATAPAAPLPGDPTCVAFAGGAGGFHHVGTRTLAVDLASLRSAVTGSAAASPAAPSLAA